MLELRNITKKYVTGEISTTALNSVTVTFSETEFAAILGTSGSGKTTLLNIIGGLDRYDSGDLIIGGKSTKEYKSRDWDTYRNHSVGFVFQSYNLIPHQTVLANVELALTLSGVSKAERRRRATEVLCRVGLGDQLKKKPNQMSGGQMQRVAIARALINNPDIVLADEPTGALDTETSRQIMDLLREISREKLVIMVTHNPELARDYATRIIRLKDGSIVSDEANTPKPSDAAAKPLSSPGESKGRKKQTSMSFFTAASLSMRNLMTKKARTFLTSFAGSIGIIGIALILSLSNGAQLYINRVQEEALTGYPITIEGETVSMQSLFSTMTEMHAESSEGQREDKIYGTLEMSKMIDSMNSLEMTSNNLKALKEYLDANESIDEYTTAVVYGYNANMTVYAPDLNGKLICVLPSDVIQSMYSSVGIEMDYGASPLSSLYDKMYDIKVWSEIMPGKNGELINPVIEKQYDVIAGSWPQSSDEVVLIVNENNELSDVYLYALGILDRENISAEEQPENLSWEYEDFIGKSFYAVLPTDRYSDADGDGIWTDMSENAEYMNIAAKSGKELKICGIIRPTEDSAAASLNGAIGYTSKLTEYIIEETNNSAIVRQQRENPSVDVFTGLPFNDENYTEPTPAQKAEEALSFIAALSPAEKGALYTKAACDIPEESLKEMTDAQMAQLPDRQTMENSIIQQYIAASGMDEATIRGYLSKMSEEELLGTVRESIQAAIKKSYSEKTARELASLSAEQLAAMLDAKTAAMDENALAQFSDTYLPASVSDSTYEENIKLLSAVDLDTPSSISLYAASFDAKEKIASLIEEYNNGVSEENRISYTDFAALLMSSVTTIISAVSSMLIAFVAISLVVSSIMIGIITYISVLERTKEIGILRAIGASKRDISRVFNAETLTVGLISGVLGIGITLLLCIPVNIIIKAIAGVSGIAQLPWQGGVILVLISMLLTITAGLIPSRIAAKKDPVAALRSE